jgi:ABC-2 type transport system permease protein
MNKMLMVAMREYKAIVKTKGFLIGLAIAPIFMAGGFLFALAADKMADTKDQRLAIVDASGLIAPVIASGAESRNKNEIYDKDHKKQTRPAYVIEILPNDSSDPEKRRLELSDRVRRGDLFAFLEIGADIVHPGTDPKSGSIRYYSKNSAMDEMRRWLSYPINNELRRLRLAGAGIDAKAVPNLFDWNDVEGMELVSLDSKTGKTQEARRSNEGRAMGVPMAVAMVMYMLVIMGAAPLMNSVVEEKNQRIAELLLSSIRPMPFMSGKLIGGIAITLTAGSVYLAAALALTLKFNWLAFVPWSLMGWFTAYLLLLILMEGSIFIAIGSACNDPRDMHNWMLPAMSPVILPLLMMMPMMQSPNSAFSTAMSLIPPFAPMLMMIRQASPAGIPTWQCWLALAEVLAFTAFCLFIGGRIFRVGILMSGKPPKLKELIRWAIRG